MRAKTKWTPGGILLWLIAAIVATIVVCSQSPPASEPPASEPPAASDQVDFELVE